MDAWVGMKNGENILESKESWIEMMSSCKYG